MVSRWSALEGGRAFFYPCLSGVNVLEKVEVLDFIYMIISPVLFFIVTFMFVSCVLKSSMGCFLASFCLTLLLLSFVNCKAMCVLSVPFFGQLSFIYVWY